MADPWVSRLSLTWETRSRGKVPMIDGSGHKLWGTGATGLSSNRRARSAANGGLAIHIRVRRSSRTGAYPSGTSRLRREAGRAGSPIQARVWRVLSISASSCVSCGGAVESPR